jgi:hypothetical protein
MPDFPDPVPRVIAKERSDCGNPPNERSDSLNHRFKSIGVRAHGARSAGLAVSRKREPSAKKFLTEFLNHRFKSIGFGHQKNKPD